MFSALPIRLMKKIYLSILLFLNLLTAFAQVNNSAAPSSSQIVRGRVLDANTEQPLAGTTLSLEDASQVYPTLSDRDGSFTFGRIPVGRYQLVARFLGYETQVINEILLETGKEQVIEVRLREGAETLVETVVKGIRPDNSVSSVQTISAEQILRFPATYLDPARLATAYAGVVNTNDQANNLSVRGNSPNGLIWRLEGVEIVNPNHLSNAGTIGDRPMPSGGGVNILSAQLLGSTRFLSGAFAPEYGNALGGIMDMCFREGNNQRHEFTAQAGLIGLDLAAEGPLNRRTGASYLVNYRYSFTGLLGLMGITFGGEDIRFSDLSVNLTLPTRKGKLTLFGLMGRSSNNFTAKADSLQQEDKDRFNIRFESWMSAGGLTYTQTLNDRWQWRLSAVASANINTRNQVPGTLNETQQQYRLYQYDRSTNARATLHNQLTYRIRDNRRLQLGLYLTRWYGSAGVWRDRQDLGYPRSGRVQEGVLWSWLVQPYANYQFTPSDKLTLNLGLHGNLFSLNRNSVSVEPRASLRWQPTQRHTFTLAYGLHSQTQQPIVYLSNPRSPHNNLNNQDLGFTKAHHLVAGYTYQLDESSSIRAEAYYQSLFNVPVGMPRLQRPNEKPDNLYSVLNLVDINEFAEVPITLQNAGKGRNMGLELTYQKMLVKNYYLLFSGSLYDSKYKTTTTDWLDTRFNGRHALNLTGGKEYITARNKYTRIWGFNARLTQLGGFRDRPINQDEPSSSGGRSYPIELFTEKLPDYFRADVRVYWKKSRTRYSRTLSLDLLNATNAQNRAYSYYDAVKGRVVQKNQLGMLPILNYRWEF
jgi:hypothetical protein